MSTPQHDPAIEPKRPEASLGDLFSEMTTELATLLRQEVQLAKTEAREEVASAAKGAALLGFAGVAGWIALVMISLAAAWLLDQALNTALSFAIVAIAWVIAAAILARAGRRRWRDLETLPVTSQTIKEDLEWARAQKS